jgi:formylglycine-generating enzyme required for sulfatase activity
MKPRAILLALAVAAAPRAALAADPVLHVDLGGGVAMDLVLVPAGTFTQGSPAGEKGREDDERQREVTLTSGYYLGKLPVTVAQFTRFVSATGYRTEAERGASGGSGWDGKALVQRKDFTWKSPGFPQAADHPVTLVTYDDAIAFTDWATRVAGRKITLPTEAQWERAYRAGKSGAYYDGATEKDALALGWFKENALAGTRPVGKKKPNAYGLHDMAGNVFEWCSDWYAPYDDGPVTDPAGPASGAGDKQRRVLRGGSWLKDPKHGRAAARYRNTPGSRNADNGFRVAAPLGTPPSPAPAAAPETPPPAPSPPPWDDGARPPSSPGPARDGGRALAVGIGCAGTAIFAGVMGLALLAMRSGKRGDARGIRFRMGPDGFWIHAPRALAGTTLHFRQRTSTGAHEGHVVLEPSDVGQFQYTGAAPIEVEVVQLIPPEPRQTGYRERAQLPPEGGPAPRQRQQRPAQQQQRPAQQQWPAQQRQRPVQQQVWVQQTNVVVAPVMVEHHHHHDHHDDRRDDDPPFRGYPSAY